MAEDKPVILNDAKVREGHVIEVFNAKRPKFSNANKKYFVIWVNENGKELPLMFSQKDIERAKHRASKNPEDVPQKSFLSNLVN